MVSVLPGPRYLTHKTLRIPIVDYNVKFTHVSYESGKIYIFIYFLYFSHVDIIMLHVDINKSNVDIIMLHVDINKSHVNIIMLHVACIMSDNGVSKKIYPLKK